MSLNRHNLVMPKSEQWAKLDSNFCSSSILKPHPNTKSASGEELALLAFLVETGESRTPRPEEVHPEYATGLVGSLLSPNPPLPTESG